MRSKAVVVCILWALCFPFITIGLSTTPPLYLAFWRALIAGLSLLLLARINGTWTIQGWKSWASVIAIGLSYTSLGFAGMFMAGDLVTPGLATVIANIQPLIAVVFAYLLAVEKIAFRGMLGLLLGLAGIIVIVLPTFVGYQGNIAIEGLGFILVGATGVALGSVLLKKVSQNVNILAVSAWQLVVGSIPLGLGSLLMEKSPDNVLNMPFVTATAVLAIPGTAISTYLWFHLLSKGKLHELNAFTFLTPVFGLLIGILFFSEVLTLPEVLGTLLVIVSITVANRKVKRKNETELRVGIN